MISPIVERLCHERAIALADPLVVDDIAVDLVSDARRAIIAWGHETRWVGRIPHQHPRGWKSPMGVLERRGCITLGAVIAETIGVSCARLQTWAMVNRAGAEHATHTHANVPTSGIFYLDNGGTPTVFDGAQFPINEADPAGTRVVGMLQVWPKRGRLVLFSGAMRHRVPSVQLPDGATERVTIAFNVTD